MSSPAGQVIDPSVPEAPDAVQDNNASLEDQTLLLLARLMEGGQEDEDTCKELNTLTKLLGEDPVVNPRFKEPHTPLYQLIDSDSVETILGYLDMRQSPAVRGYATLTTSEYLRVSGDTGVEYLSDFFYAKVGKATYDDFIVAFSVAASIFPVVPEVVATLFLSEGFVVSLGPLMKRKWKSKKVEQAALEMLNVACMNTPCREAVKKYCTEWLEEIVNVDPTDPESHSAPEDGSIQQRIHSEKVKNLAAVVLAKIQVGSFSC
jgi:protein unc-45